MVEQLAQHDPRRIGPFEVLGRLGAGGMGLVYLARSASGRRVAIKTVRTELAEDQLFRVRFTREVEAARAVSGFYTAPVVDADPRAAVPWLATAYMPAPSLEEMVNDCGPLPPKAVRWIAAGVAEALQSIHGAGLVHRDLKPSNVLVLEDGPRVIDFGIASGVSNTRLTMTNVAVGTPAYMSPEQARDSRSVTGASDVFSLGSTLVFAATGHAPFHGANPVETVFMLLREGPDLEGLPGELRPLIEACMQMTADQRPSPEALQSDLAPHLFGAAGDDSGTASAWLPRTAIRMIETRRGAAATLGGAGAHGGSSGRHGGSRGSSASRRSMPPRPAHPPSAGPGAGGVPQSAPHSVPQPAPHSAPHSAPGRHAGPPGSGPAHGPGGAGPAHAAPGGAAAAPPAAPPERVPPQPAPASAAAPPQAPGADVQLAGAPVPIGPGPRVVDARAARARAAADGGLDLGWARPRGSAAAPGTQQAPAAHSGGHPPAGSPPTTAPTPPAEAPPQEPARWRPWRFRMSNDVWGKPVVSGNLLYVTSFEVHALDVTSGRRQFKTREVAWSMALSEGLIHASDGPSLYALDAADGRERWRHGTGGWVYSLQVAAGTVVTGTRGGGLQARHAATGEPLWEHSGAQTGFETQEAGPLAHDGTVYVWGDGRLRALDTRSGAERWSYPIGDAAACGGVPVRLHPADDVAAGPTVFAAAGKRVLALDAAYGTLRWTFEAPAVILSPPAYAPGAALTGGGVFVADHLGTVYALDAADGRERWRIATEARQSIEPVLVADNHVHVGSGAALYTLDAVAGTPMWRFATRGDLIGAPVAADGRVHFGSADHCIYAVDAVGGQLRWKLATDGEITGSPVVANGVVYACSKDRCVYALDAGKGTARR
ncbi:serine/threonine-protein kinase [Streptomyces sp. CMB-StM0423]|uniref:serine/threonine-protein kinase n=1 Tax=Streptomyces sp. CMB-StM0423 TaxID=2059884 RepID=UPI000C6FD131|nr:PQQ-binding-like beta-propeller repeat protein [Streptomyces sp. CMB-StM0423]AUH42472.1 serine/threonine protein kinase [Streptomyces sp. CMB-StM0423]